MPLDDPLRLSPWSAPGTVAGFSQSPPNDALIQVAGREMSAGGRRLLDIGCGAGRNAVPLARAGWSVAGTDLSLAMLAAAALRASDAGIGARVHLALAPMHALPVRDGAFDLIVAHGIWNLARTASEFRQAVREAARVARRGAALFVFTFSRTTLPAAALPVAGEPFVFTQFSGAPQCFLTREELVNELGEAGFHPDTSFAMRELNLPRPGDLSAARPPVIFEAVFRRAP